MNPTMRKVYFHATRHPCTENAMNVNVLKRWYADHEFEVTRDPRAADVVVVSTCGFSKEQEDHEIEAIRRIGAEKKPGCELIVMGCLPEINRERLRGVFDGPTVRTSEIGKFQELMGFAKPLSEYDNHHVSAEEYESDPRIHRFVRARRFFERLPFGRVPRILHTVPSDTWWCVRCAMGCTGNCSYCGIRHAHGPIKSVPLDDIVRQAEEGIRRGYREIALTGEDLGGYGADIGCSLADLLDALCCLPGDFVVNLRFLDPHWLIRLLARLHSPFRTGRIRSFCAPAQSGSDDVLKRMNRRYTFAAVKEAVNWVARRTKVSLVTNNLIVGFPGESEADFEASLRLVREVDYGMHMVFKYEDRPGTKASAFPDKIPPAEIDRRHAVAHRAAVRRHLGVLAGW